MRQLKVIDLFCGAGLFSAGIERAGLEIVLGIDNDHFALASFQENFPAALTWDVDIIKITKLPSCEIIIGGPPCQPFSQANRDQDHNTGMELVNKFIELVEGSNPAYWIMEEVPAVYHYIKDRVPKSKII